MHAAILFSYMRFDKSSPRDLNPGGAVQSQRQKVEHGIHYTKYFWRENEKILLPYQTRRL